MRRNVHKRVWPTIASAMPANMPRTNIHIEALRRTVDTLQSLEQKSFKVWLSLLNTPPPKSH
jgi:L-amino acid N-acyltransferase YncA